jgi:phi LC3 family holin
MDLKNRFRNKAFVVSLVSAVLLAIQLILKPFDVTLDNNYIMSVVNSILAILTILGVFINPTTPNISD